MDGGEGETVEGLRGSLRGIVSRELLEISGKFLRREEEMGQVLRTKIWKQYILRFLDGLKATQVVLIIDINCTHKANQLRQLNHNHKSLEDKMPVWSSFQKISYA